MVSISAGTSSASTWATALSRSEVTATTPSGKCPLCGTPRSLGRPTLSVSEISTLPVRRQWLRRPRRLSPPSPCARHLQPALTRPRQCVPPESSNTWAVLARPPFHTMISVGQRILCQSLHDVEGIAGHKIVMDRLRSDLQHLLLAQVDQFARRLRRIGISADQLNGVVEIVQGAFQDLGQDAQSGTSSHQHQPSHTLRVVPAPWWSRWPHPSNARR